MCTSIASYLIKGLKNTKKIWEETKEKKERMKIYVTTLMTVI